MVWQNKKLEILPIQRNQFYPATFASYGDMRFSKVTY